VETRTLYAITRDSTSYQDFIAAKALVDPPSGIPDPPPLSGQLFPFQRDIVRWALRRGRAAVFSDCGTGKTIMQLEWARVVSDVAGPVLILAPIAVAKQTVREAAKFGIEAGYSRDGSPCGKITTANYEMLEHFDPADFAGIVLDESSILKSYDGSTRNAIIGAFGRTPYRLACTATPAPNDFMELGNHSEFLGILTRPEMLATFFVHDGGETQQWRLKGHAESDFWRWMCSWAVTMRRPSDLGYSDEGFVLPELRMHEVTVDVDRATPGHLFAIQAETLQERIVARRETVEDRARVAADIVNASNGPVLVWCNLNAESAALAKLIPDSMEIVGSDSVDEKEASLLAFIEGRARVLITKPSMTGFGLNLQHCSTMAFVGLSDSYEQFYQAVRRCWRFGQTRPVDVYVIAAETEGAVVANIKRKEEDAARLGDEMVAHMKDLSAATLHAQAVRESAPYNPTSASGPDWDLHNADCVDMLRAMPSDSIDFSIFSPPFASLYTYSASDRDMGNCRDRDTFYEHFGFAIAEMFRVMKPGRVLAFHCMNLQTSKSRDGEIGIHDFRGDLIRLFESHGFIYASETAIRKDPVTAMQRTKALGLLYKTIRLNASMSRMGLPDYLVAMRKPGDAVERVTHDAEDYPCSKWQQIAEPIWMDINPSDTLQFRSAREHNDERHICPLQLEVIRRAVDLWTNPHDLVLSPFAGIGSEGYVAIEQGRRFVGAELKKSYFDQAVKNLENAARNQAGLFADAE
jgi:superfamily II DNA or RNA helicase